MSLFLDMPRPIELQSLYTFITKRADSKFYFMGESHPFWELVYVMEGSVGVTADDRIYTLCEGDIIFHKPMEFHRIWASEGTNPYYIVISFKAGGDNIKKLEKCAVRSDGYIKELMEQTVEKREGAFAIKDGAVVDSIINEEKAFICAKNLEMLMCHAAESTDFIEATDDRDALLFGRGVSELKKSMGEKMTVQLLASRCFVSESKIKKVFSKYACCGVMEYFTSMKMTEAQRLLAAGKSVSAVGEYLGYSNQFYFSTVFKKTMGLSPSEFRKKHRS